MTLLWDARGKARLQRRSWNRLRSLNRLLVNLLDWLLLDWLLLDWQRLGHWRVQWPIRRNGRCRMGSGLGVPQRRLFVVVQNKQRQQYRDASNTH